jgi:ribonuclease HII
MSTVSSAATVTRAAAVPSAVPRGVAIRSDAGLYGYERALARAGLSPVAGADEAGRGACAGPLVAAAVILRPGSSGRIAELADSKLLTAKARDRVRAEIERRALAVAWVAIPPSEVDRLGLHRANIQAMRRAVARLDVTPAYVLTDGFGVDGLPCPSLAMWKGDQVAACVAAASVLAKTIRDGMMAELHTRYPEYGFDVHKGYATAAHQEALSEHGPCPEHRFTYANVVNVSPRCR